MHKPALAIVAASAGMWLGVGASTAAAFQGGPPGIADAPAGGLTPPHVVLSPPAKTSVKFDGGKITIAYGSPSMRKRVIFGELVPFNAVWRAGANDATALHSDLNLKLDGLDVAAGYYTLFVWVDQKQWHLIVNKQTGQTGLQYDQTRDLGRVPMQMSKPAKPIEHFRITLSRYAKTERGHIELAWENTIAGLDFSILTK